MAGRGLTVRPPLELPPLPQRNTPYPADIPLDPLDVKAALWHAAGNLKLAAELLHTDAARIGSLLRKDPSLADERKLAAELQVDRAEAVLLEALIDPDDKIRQDEAARFILQHAGRIRGWTKDGGAVQMNFGGGQAAAQAGGVVIRWQSDG